MSRHHALYNTRGWQRRRAEQLRKEPGCRFCYELDGRLVPASVADHVEPHHGNLVLFAGPLQSLCAHCHNSRKARQERGGHMLGCDADGVPLDPAHPWRQEVEREREHAAANAGLGGTVATPGVVRL